MGAFVCMQDAPQLECFHARPWNPCNQVPVASWLTDERAERQLKVDNDGQHSCPCAGLCCHVNLQRVDGPPQHDLSLSESAFPSKPLQTLCCLAVRSAFNSRLGQGGV